MATTYTTISFYPPPSPYSPILPFSRYSQGHRPRHEGGGAGGDPSQSTSTLLPMVMQGGVGVGGIPPQQQMSVHIPTTTNTLNSQASMSGQSSLQGQDHHALTNRVTYGMPSSVGALGAQPHRSLTSMAPGTCNNYHNNNNYY